MLYIIVTYLCLYGICLSLIIPMDRIRGRSQLAAIGLILKYTILVQNKLPIGFSNLNVLQMDPLMQDWVLRLGFSVQKTTHCHTDVLIHW